MNFLRHFRQTICLHTIKSSKEQKNWILFSNKAVIIKLSKREKKIGTENEERLEERKER
jgi:hypothetical protein